MGKISTSGNGDREVECLEATGVVTDTRLTSVSYTRDGVEGSGADEAEFGEETGDGVGGSGADEATKLSEEMELSEETGCRVGSSGAHETRKLGEKTGHGVGGSGADY